MRNYRPKAEIYRNWKGLYYVRLIAHNGNIILSSESNGYKKKKTAFNIWYRLIVGFNALQYCNGKLTCIHDVETKPIPKLPRSYKLNIILS